MKVIFFKVSVVVLVLICTKLFVSSDNFVPLTILAVTGTMYIAASVAATFFKGEKSDFFLETVKCTYEASEDEKPIHAYNALKLNLMEKVEAALDTTELESDWVVHLEPKQLEVLKSALRKRMYRNIQCLAGVEQDKPGHFDLWKHKLVTEEQWQSLLQVENEVRKEIDETRLEAAELVPGWKENIFPEVLEVWRGDQRLRYQQEMRREMEEEDKKTAENMVAAQQDEVRKRNKELKDQEIAAAKLAASLAREEERELAKKKKSDTGRKRK